MRSIFGKLSKVAARTNLSPYPKMKLIFADFMACTLLILISQTMLILYLDFVIGISFADQIGAIALIIFLGSIMATSFGYIFVLLTKSDGYIAGVTMAWCFMAGMMGPQMKAMIENAVPGINFVNPVALITDSFQKLFYFEDFTLIIPYLVALLVWTVVCLVGTALILRRSRYDSI